MRKSTKLLSMLLVVCMLVSLMPVGVLAAEPTGPKAASACTLGDPEAAYKNFCAWLTYHLPDEPDLTRTEFFSITRSDFENDTREEVFAALVRHFGLDAGE